MNSITRLAVVAVIACAAQSAWCDEGPQIGDVPQTADPSHALAAADCPSYLGLREYAADSAAV